MSFEERLYLFLLAVLEWADEQEELAAREAAQATGDVEHYGVEFEEKA